MNKDLTTEKSAKSMMNMVSIIIYDGGMKHFMGQNLLQKSARYMDEV